MAFYVDTSALLKLVVEEVHSAELRSWTEEHEGQLFSSDLLYTESLRAARRHSVLALREARRRLDVLVLMRLTPDVCERAADLDPAILRSLDAPHLAAALTDADELDGIVTYDDRLVEAASWHGVEATAPGVATGPS